MIKFIAAALWISGVTAGSVYYSFQTAHSKPPAEPASPYLGGLDYVKTDVISVPVFDNGAVYGYFLARLVYTVQPVKVKELSIPVAPMLTDQVYTYLYANPEIDFSKKEKLDLDAFRTSLKQGVNTRIGSELLHDVMVEQIDFLTKADIRDNTVRARQDEARAAKAAPPKKEPAEGGGGH